MTCMQIVAIASVEEEGCCYSSAVSITFVCRSLLLSKGICLDCSKERGPRISKAYV